MEEAAGFWYGNTKARKLQLEAYKKREGISEHDLLFDSIDQDVYVNGKKNGSHNKIEMT